MLTRAQILGTPIQITTNNGLVYDGAKSFTFGQFVFSNYDDEDEFAEEMIAVFATTGKFCIHNDDGSFAEACKVRR